MMVKEHNPRGFLVEQIAKLRRSVADLVAAGQEPMRAERLPLDRYERLQAVLDAVPGFIAYVDAGQRYRFNNRRYVEHTGRSPADLNGLHVRDVIGNEAYQRARPKIEAALTGCPVEFDMPLGTDPQGRGRHVHASYVPDVGEDGSVRGFIALVIDISEQKRAGLALAASERRWRTVFESACAGMAIVDAGGRLLETNPALRRFLGASEAELRTARCADLTYAPDREQSSTLFHQLVQGQRSDYRLEQRYVRRDQGVVWGDTAVAAVRDDERAFQYAVPMVMDTTARQKAEEALRESEARFRQILEATPDAMVIVDREGQIRTVNTQASVMFGYGREELIGRPIELLVPDRFRRTHSRQRDRYFGSPIARLMGPRLNLSARRKDGTDVPVEVSLSPVETTQGLMVIAAIRDVAERKQAEQALRKSEAAYRDLVMHATYGIYRSDRDGKLLSGNPALAKMLGYESVGELLAIDMGRDLYTDPNERETLIARYQTLHTIRDLEIKWKRKDGRRITVRLNGRAISDERGELEGFEVIVEDITEQRRLEEQFRQAQKMEAVGRLAGGVAHDFNNLLTVINGYSQLLLDRLDAGHPLRGHAEEITKAGDRAASLTRQLLAFSRRQLLQPQTLDLNVVVNDINKMLRRLIGEDVELLTILGQDLASVKADLGQIEQVLLNLAVNARDAMAQGGKFTIETANVELDDSFARSHYPTQPGHYVMLAVSDTGVGMDKETQARVLEPFFTTKELGKGTGLGLSTVYGIVKQSGGYIWVHSEVGKGTTFKIYLPRVEGVGEPLRKENPRGEIPRGSETILLAEDGEGVLGLAQRVLEAQGYTVLATSSPEEAARLSEQHAGRIDLLLTDVVMPEVGGRRLAEHLMFSRPDMKVLYMSGYTDDAVVRHGVLNSSVPFLQKPFNPDALARKVREVLDAR